VGRGLGHGAQDHAEPDRPAAGDHDDVAEADTGPLDGVQRAGKGLGESGVVGGDVGRDPVHDRLRRKTM